MDFRITYVIALTGKGEYAPKAYSTNDVIEFAEQLEATMSYFRSAVSFDSKYEYVKVTTTVYGREDTVFIELYDGKVRVKRYE